MNDPAPAQELLKPVIILVGPQMGENIGACARAMLNCDVTELRLVRPRDGWPNPAATAMAAGADHILEQAIVFNSTREALADLHRVYATTVRPRDMIKPVLTPREAAARAVEAGTAGTRVGFLFGPENAGLENADVALADAVVTAPLNPDFGSLNLAQAVLLVTYEWYQIIHEQCPCKADAPCPKDLPPQREALDMLFDKLVLLLDERGYFRSPDMRDKLILSIRNMIQRMEPTAQDVQSLHGLIVGLSRPKSAQGSETV